MNILQSIIATFGRMCISLIFILSAISQMMNWQSVELNITNSISNWMGYTFNIEWMQKIFEGMLPWVPILLLAAFILQLLGGLLVFLGIKVRLGAFLLILFIVPTTLLFHFFWMMQGPDRDLQMVMFLKNVSIFGALLYLLAHGKGSTQPKAPPKEAGKV
jgi:putative oxidoreductase